MFNPVSLFYLSNLLWMNTGYLYAFGTLVCWTVSTFVLAKLSRLTDPYTLNKATLFFGIFILGTVVCFMDGLAPWQLFTMPGSSTWFWLSISGIIGKSLGDYFGFYAVRILGARRRSMVTTLGPGFTWLFGLAILNETMNWIGLAGMLITMISLMLMISNSAEKAEVKKENYGSAATGLLFGVAASLLTGLAFILSKMTFIEKENNISAFHATWIRILAAFIALLVFDLIRKRHDDFIRPFIFNKQKALLMFMSILFGAALGLSFSLIAISRMNAAAAYTIFSLVPVAVLFISVIVYKRKVSAGSIIYSIMAIAGVIILLWRDVLINKLS